MTIKEEWISALRSGDYIQGRDALKIVDGEEETFCCLGVLCSIKNLDFVKSHIDEGKVYYGWENERGHITLTHVPGLEDSVACSLARMNDDEGLYFLEIADWIENNLNDSLSLKTDAKAKEA